MQKFQTITSRVIPLPINDVDTDQIIPAQYLTSTSKDGYAQNLFRRLKDSDPDFPLSHDQGRFKDARVLLTGYNFGCGSSREHAVWAITGAGIKVVIAQSFADIFANNSAKNGLLLVTLPQATVERLLKRAAQQDLFVTVDLDSQTVTVQEGLTRETHAFEFDQFRKHCLINGLDDIDYIASFKNEIAAWKESNVKSWLVSAVQDITRICNFDGYKN